MTPERYARVCELFDAAAALEPCRRDDFLGSACADDAVLRAEVERMLAGDAAGRGGAFLTAPCSLNLKSLLPAVGRASPIGARIGPYEIQKVIGEGGMGAVYLAARVDDYQQQVALKVIRRDLGGDEWLERFRTERQVLAGLNHPHIARLLDGGATDDGLPYLVMEYIDGPPIDRYCDAHRLGTPERVRLLQAVCEAVHHAHVHTVLHRDLKPGNVLVSADGAAKVVDFGLAKRFDPAAARAPNSDRTQTGAILGTPSYMAPEQAAGKKEVGPAADVYALGAILYELLTGRPPFRAETALDTLLLVLHEEPVPPGRLHPKLPRDLETICLKCLQKDPVRRYASANELSDDLGRFLAHEPVLARPVGWLERLWRWRRRRPAAAALAAVCVLGPLLLIAGLGVSNYLIAQKELQTENALQGERKAHDDLRKALLRAQRAPYFERVAAALEDWRSNQTTLAEEWLRSSPVEARGWEWRYVHRLCHKELLTLHGHTDHLWNVAFSADGKWIASSSEDHTARVWDAESGAEVAVLRGHGDRVVCVAFSRDGARLATVSQDETARIWDTKTWQTVRVLNGHKGGVMGVSFSPDGTRVATAGDDRTVILWDAAEGEIIRRLRGHTNRVFTAVFSPDGKTLASAGVDETIRIWDVESGEPLRALRGHAGAISTAVFSPDGARVVSAGYDATVRLWDWRAGVEMRKFTGHGDIVNSAAFSPDGRFVVSCADDSMVKIWDVGQGVEVRTLRGHRNDVMFAVYSPDGKRLATAGWENDVKIWDATADQEAIAIPGRYVGAGFGPDGRLATLDAGGLIHLMDGNTIQEVKAIPGLACEWATVSPDGRHIATGGADGAVAVRNAADGQVERVLSGDASRATQAAFSPDGERLALVCENGAAAVGAWREGRLEHTLRGRGGAVRGVCFSADGGRIAGACDDGTLRVWDAATGEDVFVLQGHAPAAYAVCFSPDGAWLASAGATADGAGEIRLWDARTGREEWTVQGAVSGPVRCLAFSPNGDRIASGAEGSGDVKLWDARTGLAAVSLPGHKGGVRFVSFSPEGDRLVSIGDDHTVRVWDAKEVEQSN